MDSAGVEQGVNHKRIEDLSGEYVEISGGSLYVDTKVIAADKWQQMVEATQADQVERGIIVSRRGNEVISSKVFKGVGERVDPQNAKNKLPATFLSPLLPHGITSLDPRMKDIVLIHTHTMPVELDHLKATIASDSDIHSFIRSKYNALVIIDNKGAHILVHRGTTIKEGELLRRNIVKETLERVKKEDGTTLDIIKSLSRELPQYGIGYFYTPSLIPDPRGYIEFHNPQDLKYE